MDRWMTRWLDRWMFEWMIGRENRWMDEGIIG